MGENICNLVNHDVDYAVKECVENLSRNVISKEILTVETRDVNYTSVSSVIENPSVSFDGMCGLTKIQYFAELEQSRNTDHIFQGKNLQSSSDNEERLTYDRHESSIKLSNSEYEKNAVRDTIENIHKLLAQSDQENVIENDVMDLKIVEAEPESDDPQNDIHDENAEDSCKRELGLADDECENIEITTENDEKREIENLEEMEGGKKDKIPKEKRKKKDRKSKQKEDLNNIHSESQRLVRESNFSLPYHHPKQMSLKDFLNRKKNSPQIVSAPKDFFYTSTPNDKKKIVDSPNCQTENEKVMATEVAINTEEVLDSKVSGTKTKNLSTFEELKCNLMAFRKSVSLPFVPKANESVIDLSDDVQPVGVQQLISRFMKHASKPASPATPKSCALNIVSKEVDDSGKEILKQEQINVEVSPLVLHGISSTGPKITELKSKLRSAISMKKLKNREKRLLAHKLDNEEGNDFEDALTDEENIDSDNDSEMNDSEHSEDDISEEDNEVEDHSDNECGEESEENEEDSSDDDDIIRRVKRKGKKCLFLDDEAEESGNESYGVETEDEEVEEETELENKNNRCDESKNAEQQNNVILKENVEKEENQVALLRRDTEGSFELFGSPIQEEKFGNEYVQNRNEEEKEIIPSSDFETSVHEISSLEGNVFHEVEPFDISICKPDENNENDLLQFCSGRFTGITQKSMACNQDYALPTAGEKNSDTSDDESSFFVGRKRIINGKKLLLQEDEDSVEAEQQDCSDEEEKSTDFTSNKKRKIVSEFFEDEAELSGSEVASEDEAEGEDDEFEEEGITDEVLNEEKLRDEIGKVHFKTMLDADKKELRFFQEMYLEDGDLHTDGEGRERKFRWKSIDDSRDDNHENRASDEEEKGEEDDENWRLNRHEREMWLKENKSLQVSPSPKKRLSLNVKLVNRTVTDVDAIKLKEAQGKNGPRSFLFRDRQYFSHLAEKYNKVEDDRIGKRATKNFVFTTTSPVKKDKPAVKRSSTTVLIPSSAKKTKTMTQRSNSVFDLY